VPLMVDEFVVDRGAASGQVCPHLFAETSETGRDVVLLTGRRIRQMPSARRPACSDTDSGECAGVAHRRRSSYRISRNRGGSDRAYERFWRIRKLKIDGPLIA